MSIATISARGRGFLLILAITWYLAPAQPGLAQIPEFSGGKLPTLAPLVREVISAFVGSRKQCWLCPGWAVPVGVGEPSTKWLVRNH